MEPVADSPRTAQVYAGFAVSAAEDPTFAAWACSVAEDPEVLAWLELLPVQKRQPNLVFAAARWHGVPAPGPYEGLRSALLADDGRILATIRERSTQTNEAWRMATLVPAFVEAVPDGRPLALIEVGASAGLCLLPDRWGYEWMTPEGLVRLGERPRLRCRVTGAAPLPAAMPKVVWRAGIDLNPLDVTDEGAMCWLEHLIWPSHEDRRAVLRLAVQLARIDPPRMICGDLLTEVPRLVDAAAMHGEVIVFHSAVIAYLHEDERHQFDSMMRELVSAGTCHWVSNEGANVLPTITAPGYERGRNEQAFVLGVDGVAVAQTHQHGRALDWHG